jgi:putative ABC transport system substrate-binding protein
MKRVPPDHHISPVGTHAGDRTSKKTVPGAFGSVGKLEMRQSACEGGCWLVLWSAARHRWEGENSDMRRREFIGLLGGAAAAWPLAARAQQAAMPVIGFLRSGTAAPFEAQLAAFRQGLKEGGYVVGQNVAIEYRWGEGKVDHLPELAADLVRRKVKVIAAVGGPPSNLAAKNATTTIPVVFSTGADPVKMGLVTNVRQPGGNVTGITFFSEELGAKALSLLRELVPGANTVGLMVNPSNPETPRRSTDAVAAARALGLTMEIAYAATPPDIEKAFDTLSERRVGALLLGADAFYGGRVQQFVTLAARHKMPAMYYRREFAEAGGLASYGTSVIDAYRQVGVYVARVLNGDKPGELPVMQAAKFEFVLNLKTARALGIDVPMAFSAAADEIIE